jgi:hypothetical protein
MLGHYTTGLQQCAGVIWATLFLISVLTFKGFLWVCVISILCLYSGIMREISWLKPQSLYIKSVPLLSLRGTECTVFSTQKG